MSDLHCPTRAIIHLNALKKNLARAQAASSGKIIAVIKANAYGHGMLPVAAALEQADAFAVATLDEALILRAAYLHAEIIIIQGFYHISEIEVLSRYRLIPVIHSPKLLAQLLESSAAAGLRVVLEHNSGMNRAGLSGEDFKAAVARIEAQRKLEIVFVMTHFRSANREDPRHSEVQVAVFKEVIAGIHYRTSLCNSAALLGFPAAHADYERPGLMLYGASPLDNKTAAELGLTSVMSVTSRLIAVHQLQTGDEVGYEGVWRAKSACRIGLVPVGYGDGYPWISQRVEVPVLVRGRRCTLAGRVSMDTLSVDLTNCPQAQVGDEVILWGKDLPVDEVAQATGQLVYDLLTGITLRVPRIYH